MIIKDVDGGKLSLTKTTLSEVTGESIRGERWTLRLEHLIGAVPGKEMPIFRNGNVSDTGWAELRTLTPTTTTIGCRTFSKKTYALILKNVRALAKAKKG